MGIGVDIVLVVAGAILTFAVDAMGAGLGLDVVGWHDDTGQPPE